MATAPEHPHPDRSPRVRLLDAKTRDVARAFLRREPERNLFLLDLVSRVGRPSASEVTPSALGVWQGEALIGVASLRPTIAIDAELEGEALDMLCEPLSRLQTGLIRSLPAQVERVWQRLAAAGRRTQVDRIEQTLGLYPPQRPRWSPSGSMRVREAVLADLEALVEAARRSLREEGRPDPFVGDARGFRRWVRARLPRAMVAERDGHVVFVAYADVQLQLGWLVQGVYTWPEARRQGFAAAGVAALCAKAFAAGARHVQLSVVLGNEAAFGLYAKLGFRRRNKLRTLLFTGAG